MQPFTETLTADLEGISIRQASCEDIPSIMKFIDENWRKGDALAVDRDFFEWSFVRNGKVTFIIAVDDETNQLYGILGYMPYTDDDIPDCYCTIWKVKPGTVPFLGMKLVEYLKNNIPIRYITGAGLRNKTIKLKKLQNKPVIRLDHYYRLNELDDYFIADITDREIRTTHLTNKILTRIESIEDFKKSISEDYLKSRIFKKDYKYINKRYFDHPVYSYELWGIGEQNGIPSAVVVAREERHLNSASYKIIDYYGEERCISEMGILFDEIMKERHYEFTDIYSFGIDKNLYIDAGFEECGAGCANIIPNYFHPFERRNIDIYMELPNFQGLKLFRGDGDQDRPCGI